MKLVLHWKIHLKELSGKKDKNNYFNPYLGVPSYGHGVDSLYRQGLTPKQAVKKWRSYNGKGAIL